MVDKKNSIPDSGLLSHEHMRQKLFAFAITACSCFVLVSLCWPLAVKGFRSKTAVFVEIGDSESEQQNSRQMLSRSHSGSHVESPLEAGGCSGAGI